MIPVRLPLKVQPALDGSYEGVDKAGLYWSMTAHGSDDTDPLGIRVWIVAAIDDELFGCQ